MKQIRFIVSACIALLVFTGCSDDDQISYALQNISAPTNVEAVFDIAQDDTGTVSVTPTAVGASSFNVFYGDTEGETPTQVSPGETVSHVYGEGTYELRIVAVGATGLTSELVRVVTISFTPPSDLAVDISISDTNPFQIEVAPTAENAAVFDIYYGDAENEEPQTIMAGETATHIYAETGDFTVRVVARGAGSATVEYTEVVTISGASDPIGLPITFDIPTVNYAFGTFSGASFEVVENPDPSGANPVVSKVGAITNSGNTYEGGAFDLGTPVDFSGTNKTIFMKMWSNVAVPVLMKFEGGVNGERQNEVSVDHNGTGWELLSFDFANDAVKSYIDGTQGVGEPFVPTGQYATLVLFIDGPGTTAGTFYIDDIEQEAALVAPQLPIDFEGTGFDYTWIGFGAADGSSPIPAGVIANPDASGINTSANVTFITKTDGAQVWAGASLNLAGPIDFSQGTTINVKVWSPRAGTPILLKIEDSTSPPDMNGNPSVAAEVQVPTIAAGAWEELSFDLSTSGSFNASNSYDRIIFFPDFGTTGQNEDFYFDDIAIASDNGGGGTTPTQAAPNPTQAQANVINLFSDSYTQDVAVSSWRSDWSTSTLTDIQIGGNNTKEYIGADFVGVEFYAPNQVDATEMDFFHVDVWTPNATTFRVKLVDLGGAATEAEIAFEGIAQGEWVSLDIPMDDFVSAGMNAVNSIQQLIFSGLPTGTFDFYIDNVYFYRVPPTSPQTAAPDPTEAQTDVINMYSNVYTQDVSVSSWRSDWSTSTLTDIQVEGNDTKEYIDADFVGVEFYGSPVDASGMGFFHVDVWTPNATTFRVKLVDLGGTATEAEIAFEGIAQGEWVSLDIPMSDFINGGMTATNSIQQLIFSGLPTGTFDFYIDNVYFHN